MGKYKNEADLTFEVKTKLSDIITKPSFGFIDSNSAEDLLSLINSNNNSTLTLSDISFSNITDTSAVVTASEDSKYEGSVTLSYTLRIDLNVIISVKDIGYIENNENTTILNKLNKVNKLNLTSSDVAFVNTSTEATTVVPA